jgi:hypothetical protein
MNSFSVINTSNDIHSLCIHTKVCKKPILTKINNCTPIHPITNINGTPIKKSIIRNTKNIIGVSINFDDEDDNITSQPNTLEESSVKVPRLSIGLTPIGIPHANKIKSIIYDKNKRSWVDKKTGSEIIYVSGQGWINSVTGLKVVYK